MKGKMLKFGNIQIGKLILGSQNILNQRTKNKIQEEGRKVVDNTMDSVNNDYK